MLGAFIGDLVGSVYEFKNTRDYNFHFITKYSNITDDSVMTAAVADWAMSDCNFTHERLEEKLVSYAIECPHPGGGYGVRFRKWLFKPSSLNNSETGEKGVKRMPYNSWGNGSAMRVSSIGWMFDSLHETERVAGISASITHNHPEGIKGAQATAVAIYLARTGNSKKDIRSFIEKRYNYDLSDTWENLHKNYKWDSSCQGTVPQAIICFLESHDFESAIRNAVSIGGDSDTIACITGAIAEAYYADIPDWILNKVLEILPPRLLYTLRKLCYCTNYSRFMNRFGKNVYDLIKYTPQHITELKDNEIFVFGSNIEGKHLGGAARFAYERFDAQWGVGEGLTGKCYAIPTMQGGVETIRPYIERFIVYARNHSNITFYVTKIGCGIAGFTEDKIAPLFVNANDVYNIILPKEFVKILYEKEYCLY